MARQLCKACGKPLFGFGRCQCPIKKPKSKLVLADPEMAEAMCFVIGQMRRHNMRTDEEKTPA